MDTTQSTIMVQHDYERKVLDLVSLMGETLLLNGAEIARVQQTMEMVAKAYGKEEIDVYAISNGIFVTLHHEDKTRSTQIKHVPLATPHLGRVSKINELSRNICEHHISLDDATLQMRQILEIPTYPVWIQILAYAIGGGCFCYLLGGTWLDLFAVAPVVTVLFFAQQWMGKAKLSKVIQTILGSALITLGGILLSSLFPVLNMDKIIIGGLIILVPGVPLTTSVRDLSNGDYLSGTIRLIDAVLVSVSMAIGVGFVYYFFK